MLQRGRPPSLSRTFRTVLTAEERASISMVMMMVGMMAPPLSTRMTQGAVTRLTMAAVATRDQEGGYEWDQEGG